MWVADNDPMKEKELEKMPLIAYYFKLNKKVSDTKKAIAEQQANLQKKPNGRPNNH